MCSIRRAGQRRLEKAADALKVSGGLSPCEISRPRHLEAAAGQARSSFGQVLFREERRRSSAPSHCRTAVLGQADGCFSGIRSGANGGGAWCGWADGYTRHLRVNQISVNGGLLGELRRYGVFANGPIETALTLWGACSRSRNRRL